MKKKRSPGKRLRRRRRNFRTHPLTEAEIKKSIRKMLRPTCAVEVYYRGFDRTLERQITKLAKRPSEGSGMFMTGLRDLRFDGFASEERAMVVARRILNAHLPGVRVTLRVFREIRL